LFFCRKLHFGSHAAQYPKDSDSVCFQATVTLIRLMTSLCGTLYQFAMFASQNWWKVHCQNIEHCSFCWLCCWARCWMMQDMDSMEASCVIYVKVGMLNHLERSFIRLVTVNKAGIVMLTAQHNLIVSVSLMYYHGDFLRHTSADILSLQECPIYIRQSCDFGCQTAQLIPGNTLPTSDRLIVSHGTVGNLCNLQPYPAGFSLGITCNLAATYFILTWS